MQCFWTLTCKIWTVVISIFFSTSLLNLIENCRGAGSPNVYDFGTHSHACKFACMPRMTRSSRTYHKHSALSPQTRWVVGRYCDWANNYSTVSICLLIGVYVWAERRGREHTRGIFRRPRSSWQQHCWREYAGQGLHCGRQYVRKVHKRPIKTPQSAKQNATCHFIFPRAYNIVACVPSVR